MLTTPLIMKHKNSFHSLFYFFREKLIPSALTVGTYVVLLHLAKFYSRNLLSNAAQLVQSQALRHFIDIACSANNGRYQTKQPTRKKPSNVESNITMYGATLFYHQNVDIEIVDTKM
jgi:hypothetical protein